MCRQRRACGAFASGAPLPRHRAVIASRRARHTPQAQLRMPRRALLATVALSLAPRAASADRTGKFSTKLTAKRRYVPRITRGAQCLFSEGCDEAALDDLLTAMDLFGTTYFSEGNRIGERERELRDSVAAAKGALTRALKARARKDDDGATAAMGVLRDAVAQWLRTAEFERIAGVQLL